MPLIVHGDGVIARDCMVRPVQHARLPDRRARRCRSSLDFAVALLLLILPGLKRDQAAERGF
jgi:hypothetical protein